MWRTRKIAEEAHSLATAVAAEIRAHVTECSRRYETQTDTLADQTADLKSLKRQLLALLLTVGGSIILGLVSAVVWLVIYVLKMRGAL